MSKNGIAHAHPDRARGHDDAAALQVAPVLDHEQEAPTALPPVRGLVRPGGDDLVSRSALEGATATGPTPPAGGLMVGGADDAAEVEADRLSGAFAGDVAMQHSSAAPGEGGVGAAGGPAGDDVERAIHAERGKGRPLATVLRKPLEDFFGTDLSAVRTHDGAAAHRVSRSVNAHAFTLGNDIFFGKGAYRPDSPGGRRLLAHEMTHVVQQGGAVSRAVKVRRAPMINRLSFGQLSSTQQKQVDAQAQAEYYRQAAAFEMSLGSLISKTPEAQSAVTDMTKRVRKLVDAWCEHKKMDKSAASAEYEYVFGRMGGNDTGSISPILEDIKAVLDKGSLRERLTLIYSAIRSDRLQELLNRALQDALAGGKDHTVNEDDGTNTNTTVATPTKGGLAKAAGLQKHLAKNGPVSSEMRTRTGAAPVNKRSNLFGRKQLVTEIEQSGEKQFVQVNGGFTVDALEGGGMSERELRNQVNSLRRNKGEVMLTEATAKTEATKAGQTVDAWLLAEYRRMYGELTGAPLAPTAATPSLWKGGENYYRAQVDSKLAIHASKIKALLRAATSGTTDMYLHAAQYLGMDSAADLKKIRLAMLAWMLPARDHSFYEIMTSATQYGLNDFNPDEEGWKAYERPIAPLKLAVNEWAKARPPAGVAQPMFPGFYLTPAGYPQVRGQASYREVLATAMQAGDALVRTEDEIAMPLAAGVPRGIAEALTKPQLVMLKDLMSAIAKLRFNDPTPDVNDLTYTNLLAAKPASDLIAGIGAADGHTVVAILVAKMHPSYALPAKHAPYAKRARLLTPMKPGERMSTDELDAVDLTTSPALKNVGLAKPDQGAQAVYQRNKQAFIDEVLKYDPTKYRNDPEKMNAWFETYGRRLQAAFPDADLDQLRALNTAREKAVAAKSDDLAAIEKAFDEAFRKVFGFEKLTQAELTAIHTYTVSAVANGVNAASKGERVGGLPKQDPLADWADTAELMISGLEKLPAFRGGPVFRGDGDRGFAVGKVIHYKEFVSTAKTVNSSFINKSNISWATHAIVIENHRTGKDIMPLSQYSSEKLEKMEGEILFPPGSRFVVTRIEDWRNIQDVLAYTKQSLKQVMDDLKNAPGDAALLTKKTKLQLDLKQLPARQHQLNKVWVYMDEV